MLPEVTERALGMIRKFPQFISKLFEILMKMLLDIEDEAAWHMAENEDEDAGESRNYSVAQECLDSCGGGPLGEPARNGEGQCGNTRLLLKQRKRILMAGSDVSCWGVFLKVPIANQNMPFVHVSFIEKKVFFPRAFLRKMILLENIPVNESLMKKDMCEGIYTMMQIHHLPYLT